MKLKKYSLMNYFELKRYMVEIVNRLSLLKNNCKYVPANTKTLNEYVKLSNELAILKRKNKMAWLEIQ
jgi:hypothetical protein